MTPLASFVPRSFTIRSMRPLPLLLLLASLFCCLALNANVSAQAVCASSTHSCFSPSITEAGCSNPNCCSTVCAIEPMCCAVAWDALCVSLAEKFCTACGSVAESCFVAHSSGSCRDGACCEVVCATDPGCCSVAWDAQCVKLANALCVGCGAPGAGSCKLTHEAAGCNDSSCCSTVCIIDAHCCETTWDQVCVDWAQQLCPDCGNPNAKSCCFEHATPFCSDETCCQLVCALDQYCCEDRWDFYCAQSANINCTITQCTCGDPTAGSCKSAHATAGCSDFRCCNDVCAVDAFCCVVEWDYTCATQAGTMCAIFVPSCADSFGSCYVRHNSAGCDEPGCCEQVCAIDSVCCTFEWDAGCVDLAARHCNGCGDIESESCFYPHFGPSCYDPDCCDSVCILDPRCCELQWDMFCVLNAYSVCEIGSACGSLLSRPCGVPSRIAGCSDAGCCSLICSLDPTCCSRAWDETCAANATNFCDRPPNCPNRGDPFLVHPESGCADEFCCTAVCEVEPICCQLGWDANCVYIAQGICYSVAGCPGSGKCGVPHTSPGCDDPTCCNIVCRLDPVCCTARWDVNCVASAAQHCVPRPSWPCPCFGDCFETHANAGCNDETCCAGVCSIDETCCTVAWDASCTALARVYCCSTPGCGDSCAGSCIEEHVKPNCNDAVCCTAVCRYDPFCCSGEWDVGCVRDAIETCEGGCGLVISGSCFAPHGFAGCADATCCTLVCNDPAFLYCCFADWDQLCADKALVICAASAPDCGDIGGGSCCEVHARPSCNDASCCNAVCAVDDYCCTVEWDQACVDISRTQTTCNQCDLDCGDECAGPCCEPKDTPACSDAICCAAVCLIDPICCSIAWDQFCAAEAKISSACNGANGACPQPPCGTPEAQGCCFPHSNANCSDKACCNEVCAIDDYCCTIEWDNTCAALAGDVCDVCGGGIGCGSKGTGSCYNAHVTPFCSDSACCLFVCSVDPTCCSDAWDDFCVEAALFFCNGN